MSEQMTKQDAIEYLLYMKHDVQAKSPMDIALDTAIEALKQPTISPKVRRGRWIEDNTDMICSVCKWEYSDELPFMSNNGLDSMTEAFAHCPHCGAKMDGGADNG